MNKPKIEFSGVCTFIHYLQLIIERFISTFFYSILKVTYSCQLNVYIYIYIYIYGFIIFYFKKKKPEIRNSFVMKVPKYIHSNFGRYHSTIELEEWLKNKTRKIP